MAASAEIDEGSFNAVLYRVTVCLWIEYLPSFGCGAVFDSVVKFLTIDQSNTEFFFLRRINKHSFHNRFTCR